VNDPWYKLRAFTEARIGQGAAGCSMPTAAHLDFQVAHALARDAVLRAWDVRKFEEAIAFLEQPILTLATQAVSRKQYLQRPDQGRQLNDLCRRQLIESGHTPSDLVFIMSNGLSSTALMNHGVNLLLALLESQVKTQLSLGPICLIPDGRVALSDSVGALLGAKMVIMIVGERPGLSTDDSLGIYLTYGPQEGRSDADRNCISNIRPPHGMGYRAAAEKTFYLIDEAFLRGYSGVLLKDEMITTETLAPSETVRIIEGIS